MKNFRLFSVIISGLILSGCASLPKSSIDVSTDSKNITIPVDKALVYFVRPGSSGLQVQNYIFGNDKFIGTLGRKTYLVGTFDPGRYRFHTLQRYPRKGNSEQYTTLSIELEANKTYYYKPVRSDGVDGLQELNLQEGEFSIIKCNLSGVPQFVTAEFKSSDKTISGFFVMADDSVLVLNSFGRIYKIRQELISPDPDIDPKYKNGVMVWEKKHLARYAYFNKYSNYIEINSLEDIEDL